MNAVALVTGAASGIGRATAVALHQAGYVTYATGRRLEALEELRAGGLRVLQLDVTDDASVQAAAATVLSECSRLDVLVNNAGLGPLGPVEDFRMERWHELFETNVFGVVRMMQAVLPPMREQGRGRIITIGSMGGQFTTAFGGAYHASKYSLEAISDAARVEVRPFGVQVVLLQPGPVRTPLADRATDILAVDGSVYGPAVQHMSRVARAAVRSGRGVETPERVARVVLKAASVPRPRDRYKIGPVAHLLPFLRRWLPRRVWDWMQARQSGTHLLPVSHDRTRASR